MIGRSSLLSTISSMARKAGTETCGGSMPSGPTVKRAGTRAASSSPAPPSCSSGAGCSVAVGDGVSVGVGVGVGVSVATAVASGVGDGAETVSSSPQPTKATATSSTSRNARHSVPDREERLEVVLGEDLEGDHRVRALDALQRREAVGDDVGDLLRPRTRSIATKSHSPVTE